MPWIDVMTGDWNGDDRSTPLNRITDGTSNTIMFSERIPGLSRTGASQFASGNAVTNHNDRQLLAKAAFQILSAGQQPSSPYFYPANTKYTTVKLTRAAQSMMDLAFRQKLALTFEGARQFLSAEPVLNPSDRKALTAVFVQAAIKWPNLILKTG
jgi:hypothetical protein